MLFRSTTLSRYRRLSSSRATRASPTRAAPSTLARLATSLACVRWQCRLWVIDGGPVYSRQLTCRAWPQTDAKGQKATSGDEAGQNILSSCNAFAELGEAMRQREFVSSWAKQPSRGRSGPGVAALRARAYARPFLSQKRVAAGDLVARAVSGHGAARHWGARQLGIEATPARGVRDRRRVEKLRRPVRIALREKGIR